MLILDLLRDHLGLNEDEGDGVDYEVLYKLLKKGMEDVADELNKFDGWGDSDYQDGMRMAFKFASRLITTKIKGVELL